MDLKKYFNKDIVDRLIDYQDENRHEKKLKLDLDTGKDNR